MKMPAHKKRISPIAAVLILAAGIGTSFIFPGPAFSKPQEIKELPFGLSNPLEEDINILPEVLQDLGLSEDNGVAGFVVDSVARKNAEICADKDCSAVKYNFSQLNQLIDVVVGKGKANLWLVINPVSSYKFTDGKLRRDNRTYLPDGPISRQAYRNYLRELVNHAGAIGVLYQVVRIGMSFAGIFLMRLFLSGARHSERKMRRQNTLNLSWIPPGFCGNYLQSQRLFWVGWEAEPIYRKEAGTRHSILRFLTIFEPLIENIFRLISLNRTGFPRIPTTPGTERGWKWLRKFRIFLSGRDMPISR